MHFHIDALNLRSLATVFIVSIVWHAGDRLVALFAPHQTNSPPSASHQVANIEQVNRVEPRLTPRSEQKITLSFVSATGPYDPFKVNRTAAVPRNFEERWYGPSEPKREATPFERRGMFDAKI
jgi:hypothetical protein